MFLILLFFFLQFDQFGYKWMMIHCTFSGEKTFFDTEVSSFYSLYCSQLTTVLLETICAFACGNVVSLPIVFTILQRNRSQSKDESSGRLTVVICCKKTMANIAIFHVILYHLFPKAAFARTFFLRPNYDNAYQKYLCREFFSYLRPTVTSFPILILSVRRELLKYSMFLDSFQQIATHLSNPLKYY